MKADDRPTAATSAGPGARRGPGHTTPPTTERGQPGVTTQAPRRRPSPRRVTSARVRRTSMPAPPRWLSDVRHRRRQEGDRQGRARRERQHGGSNGADGRSGASGPAGPRRRRGSRARSHRRDRAGRKPRTRHSSSVAPETASAAQTSVLGRPGQGDGEARAAERCRSAARDRPAVGEAVDELGATQVDGVCARRRMRPGLRHRLPALVDALARARARTAGVAPVTVAVCAVDVAGRHRDAWAPGRAGSPAAGACPAAVGMAAGPASAAGGRIQDELVEVPPGAGRRRARRRSGCARRRSARRGCPAPRVMPVASGPQGTTCTSPPSSACWVEPTTDTSIGLPVDGEQVGHAVARAAAPAWAPLHAGDADLGDAERQGQRSGGVVVGGVLGADPGEGDHELRAGQGGEGHRHGRDGPGHRAVGDGRRASTWCATWCARGDGHGRGHRVATVRDHLHVELVERCGWPRS